jgi:site-specific DNA-methyltransferase (cytosine-N4-specific)
MDKNLYYKTELGKFYLGDSTELLNSTLGSKIENKVQLILTSPPFPLNKKKKYGNLTNDQYKEWFKNLAPLFSKLITDNGSIVIELGNAWEKNKPVQSTLNLESLIGFRDEGKLNLCQEFICYNPSRLPSPAQWVTIERIRTTDSFTHIWWLSKTGYPKADNKKVLRPYSKSMINLLKNKKYNYGNRPSEHKIGRYSFLNDNGGSIMPNILELEESDPARKVRLPENFLSIANTKSNDFFLKKCREKGITPHPARMPLELAYFFIEFLTDEGDLVLDPFAGSNTTGFCAENKNRKWISIDNNEEYAKQSLIRLEDPQIKQISKIKL